MMQCIYGVLNLWCAAYWLQYFFGVLHHRRVASLVLCICNFGMLCAHSHRYCENYCAMHLLCIVSWSWVQYIFGVASLVLCIVS